MLRIARAHDWNGGWFLPNMRVLETNWNRQWYNDSAAVSIERGIEESSKIIFKKNALNLSLFYGLYRAFQFNYQSVYLFKRALIVFLM